MGHNVPSFFFIKNHGVDQGKSIFSMYHSASFSFRNFAVASSSACESGYTLQLMVAGALGFNLIAWSSGQASGKHLAAVSKNTL
jgi:hypothetical protein